MDVIIRKQWVGGSSPLCGTNLIVAKRIKNLPFSKVVTKALSGEQRNRALFYQCCTKHILAVRGGKEPFAADCSNARGAGQPVTCTADYVADIECEIAK